MAFQRKIYIKTKLYVHVLAIIKFTINHEKHILSQNIEQDMIMYSSWSVSRTTRKVWTLDAFQCSGTFLKPSWKTNACSVLEQRNNRWQENQSQEAWHNVNGNETKMLICCRLLYKNDHSQKVLRQIQKNVCRKWQPWCIRHILFNYLEVCKVNCALVVNFNETI